MADWLSLIPPWKHPIDSLLSMERGKVGVRERIGEKGGREREGGREAGERLRRAEKESEGERGRVGREREKREREREEEGGRDHIIKIRCRGIYYQFYRVGSILDYQ